ncbi:hypothetical protein UFOVP71_35 [uncultured Caudovirales phage]|uniref:Uncharacterized protein n=1 Tax=uncultured Caudovirales phage TaxID=2100421 RepID=A0A6J5TC05_9CAUD|nr:hypothetical protein UFOVP71_35 [uncultured Caudovirales phage]
MPRISLWKNAKTNDFYYQDRIIRDMVDASGTTMLVHKYLGPAAVEDGSDPAKPNLAAKTEITELDIQDVLFLENRDRVYDTTLYELRGTYNVNDQDFDLSQFGLFLNADTLFITFHTNEMVNRLGRKLMPGDVIELPHLNDDLLLDATAKSINKFYVVQDASRAAEGFGPTWWPHLWRIKVAPMNDAQEYRGILGDPEDEDSLKNALSTYNQEIQISNAIIESAAVMTPGAGYTNPVANQAIVAPVIKGFDGSGVHDFTVNTVANAAANGDTTGVARGLSFPDRPTQGELFARADFTPERLFVYRGNRWHRVMDNLSQQGWSTATMNAGTYINNENVTSTNSKGTSTTSVPERQPLSKVFTKPKADN